MTDELSPTSRALLDSARAGLSPDAEAIARMRSKIDLAVGGASASTVAVTTSSLAPKLMIVGVVAAIAIGGIIYSRDDGRASASPTTQATTVDDDGVERAATIDMPPAVIEKPPSTVDSPATTIPDERATTVPEKPATVHNKPAIVDKPATMVVDKPATKAGEATKPVEKARPLDKRPVTKPVDLAREVELVDRAMAALKRGDTAAALAAIADHARETAGRGQLAEDAAAIEIEALCRSKRDVSAKLDAFDARWPTSAQRSRLTSACH